MVLGRNLEQSRESLTVLVNYRANLLCDVLVDEENGNVFTVLCESLKVAFDV